MKTIAEVIGVSRSNLAERLQQHPLKRIGRPPFPDEELVAQIKAAIAELPTYGYRRIHAILKRQALAAGLKAAQSQAGLSRDEGPWPPARSPCWRCRAPA
jgi:hypothetical protein